MTAPTFTAIESAAHQGAYGDNDLPLPTDAQRKAGNYRMGRVTLHGLRIAIEQPRGSTRSGTDRDGTAWTCRLAAHYGYFIGTRGADGDGVDVFIAPNPAADTAYVINQNVGGRFDEHKVVLGAVDEEHARNLYLASYARGWRGLASVVPATIPQLKHWLRHGNKRRALTADQLHPQGTQSMNRVFWNSDAQPEGLSLDQVLYHVRISDGGENLLLDAVSMADILEDSEGVIALDAMVLPVNMLNRRMGLLKTIMERAGDTVKPLNVQISDPFKQRGVTNVAAVFELSDGQTVSIYFHNPDTTPNRLVPTDELVSWKWLLNKKDITIVVAPERGNDLNPREVARRIMRLAQKNSAAFQRANAKRTERMATIQSLKSEVAELETELQKAQRELEVEQILAEDRLANPAHTPDPSPRPKPEGDEPATDRYGQNIAELNRRGNEWERRIAEMSDSDALKLAFAAGLTKAMARNVHELLVQEHPDDLDAAFAKVGAEGAAEDESKPEAGIAEVAAAMKLTTTGNVWWEDSSINRAINAGVAAGWLRRPSTTQVEWTEEGVALARAQGEPAAPAGAPTHAEKLAAQAESARRAAETALPGTKEKAKLEREAASLQKRAKAAASAKDHDIAIGSDGRTTGLPELPYDFLTEADVKALVALGYRDLVEVSNGDAYITRKDVERNLEESITMPPHLVPAAKAALAQVAAGAAEREPFEHAGRRIYPTAIKGVGGRWAVQIGEQPGVGDTLWQTREEAIAEADLMQRKADTTEGMAAKLEADRKALEEARAAQAAAEAESAAEEAAALAESQLGAYLATLSVRDAGLAKKVLQKQISFNGEVMTRAQYIEKKHAAGELNIETEQQDKIKAMSRRAFNRASQQEQDAHAKRVADGGKKTVYYVNDYDMGALAYAYAAHLLGEAGAAGEQGEVESVTMPALANATPEFMEWLAENAAAVAMVEAVETTAKDEGGTVVWGADPAVAMDSVANMAIQFAKPAAVAASAAVLATLREVVQSQAFAEAAQGHSAALVRFLNTSAGAVVKAGAMAALAKLMDDVLDHLKDNVAPAVKGRLEDLLHDVKVLANGGIGALRTKEAKAAARKGETLDSAEADADDDDFDEDAEWEATPDDEDEEPALDGDFAGHPFRGNQYRKGSRTSGTAVAASIHAKKVAKAGSERDVRRVHRMAHHSHVAASLAVTTRTARRYHRKMARLHAKHAGVEYTLDSVEVLDGVADMHATAVLRNSEGAEVGMVLIYQDGSAGVRDAAGSRATPVTEDVAAASDGVRAVLKAGGKVNDRNAMIEAMKVLQPFLSQAQKATIGNGARGEEKQYFYDKAVELAATIRDMPETYGQDGKGDQAVAYLHYFKGGADWYITEKDKGGGDVENVQQQAFGLADLFGDGGELGYISIAELTAAGVELDLHWTPKTLAEIRGKDAEPVGRRNLGVEILDALADAGWTPMAPANGTDAVAETTRNGIRLQFHANINAKPSYAMLAVWDGDAWVPPPSEAGVKSVTLSDKIDVAALVNEIEAGVARIVTVMENDAGDEGAGGDDELVEAGVLAAKQNGIARVLTSDHFTMEFEGDDVLVNDELRAQIEAKLGEPLVEATVPGLEAQVTLVPASMAPEASPSAEPEAVPQLAQDKALFQSVIDGTVADILAPSLADDLEAAFLRHEGDAVMAGLFEQAVNAYQVAMLSATASL